MSSEPYIILNLNSQVERGFKEQYSKKECLDRLSELSSKLGRRPSCVEIDSTDGFPSTMVFRRHFKTLNNAYELLGFSIVKGHRYSKQDCIDELNRVMKEIGQVPTREDFIKHSNMSVGVIRRQFGNWNNLLKEIGMELSMPKWTDDELRHFLLEFYKTDGRVPIQEDFCGDNGKPHYSAYYVHFGSWTNALKSVGFKKETSVYISNCGHKCYSVMEQYVCNYLHKNNIEHMKEVFYPLHIFNPNKKMRCDWVINGVYIELCGLIRREEYRKKMLRKEKILQDNNLPYLFLLPTDIKKLEEKLKTII